MLDRRFHISEQGSTVRTEILAGITTFLTMAYIVFLQPAVLSGRLFGGSPEADIMPFGAVMTATCLSAAIATLIMGLYANYPIAQAPGMGENFIFVLSLVPAAQVWIDQATAAGRIEPGSVAAWQIGLGVVFISGVLFLIVSLLGLRTMILGTISPSMRNAIAAGIGLFIAFIGLQGATVIVDAPGQLVRMNPHVAVPDVVVFFFGLLVTAGLHGRRVPGSIIWGIVATTLFAVGLREGLPWLAERFPSLLDSTAIAQSNLLSRFTIAAGVVASPPSLSPTFLKFDVLHALTWQMLPFILLFLFMDVFDTLGTLVGVSEQAGLVKDGELPRARRAMLSDALGTVVGASCGTSTVTSFIESAAGVEQGGRTGLTAVVVAVLFLAAPFFAPLVEMVGSYPSITAPALFIVGSMMMRNVLKIEWTNPAEAVPAFVTIIGIPLSYSIADGLALGFICYPVVKLLAGQGKDVGKLSYLLAILLIVYLVAVRSQVG
ncbi:MAG: NCS2 family permease [Planctomycetota bacterium]|nr:MAG: NCS2 family permease [Planctomycetota bacterium]